MNELLKNFLNEFEKQFKNDINKTDSFSKTQKDYIVAIFHGSLSQTKDILIK